MCRQERHAFQIRITVIRLLNHLGGVLVSALEVIWLSFP
jgi:hypothetical protein